jgi:threonine synthase
VAETAATIRRVLEEDDYLLDPHTATAVKVARGAADPKVPMVVLATAHPAKFPAAVQQASGVSPQLPAFLSDLMERKEKFAVLPSDPKMLEDYVMRHTRAARVQGVSH